MQSPTIKKARMLSCFLCVLALVSVASVFLFIQYAKNQNPMIAEVYQNGNLITSIPLNNVEEPYSFTVHAENGRSNVIEVHRGAIGIITADCPDQICVHQGFIKNSILPITCLPHRLVIQIRKENPTWD